MPAGKTPLFVGGSGVTLEKQKGPLDAPVAVAVYLLGQMNSTATLALPASVDVFTVHVDRASREKWGLVTVTDSHGRNVTTEMEGYALTFVPTPGETYHVRAAR